jgi:hypothetical protein
MVVSRRVRRTGFLEKRAVMDDATVLIDRALARFAQRDLVSSGEVADLLLDIRLAIKCPVSGVIVPAGDDDVMIFV